VTGSYTLAEALLVDHNLMVNASATLDTSSSSYAMTITGAFTDSGTFTGNTSSITLSGNLTVGSSATYSGSGTVLTLAGSSAQTIAVSDHDVGAIAISGIGEKDITQDFASSALSATVNGKIVFTAGILWTFSGTTIAGPTDSGLFRLVSSTPGSPWFLTVGMSVSATAVLVSDSDASQTITACDGISVDGGGNSNWDFSCAAVIPTGISTADMLIFGLLIFALVFLVLFGILASGAEGPIALIFAGIVGIFLALETWTLTAFLPLTIILAAIGVLILIFGIGEMLS